MSYSFKYQIIGYTLTLKMEESFIQKGVMNHLSDMSGEYVYFSTDKEPEEITNKDKFKNKEIDDEE